MGRRYTILENEIKSAIDFRFSKRSEKYLIQALTRKGYAKERVEAHEKCESQEDLAVLGDGILRAVLTELLMKEGYTTKGDLTKKRSKLENNATLASIADERGIGKDAIRLTKTELNKWEESEETILSDTLEALIGAIHLASGYARCRLLIKMWFKDSIDELGSKTTN